MLVCLYGVREGGKVSRKAFDADWAKFLLRIKIPELRELIAPRQGLLEKSVQGPPLRKVHEKARKLDRDVLAAFRFYTVRNLYVRPSPQ
jgi:hypothetical protein